MFFVLKWFLIVAVLVLGAGYVFKDSELMQPLMAEISPERVNIHPAEPVGRVAFRFLLKRKISGEDINRNAMQTAYDQAVDRKYIGNTGVKAKAAEEAGISIENYLGWEKDGLQKFHIKQFDRDSNGQLSKSESRMDDFAFKSADTSGDNQLSLDELWALQQRKIAGNFKRFDTNRDNVLSPSEYADLLSSTQISEEKFLDQIDANKNNFMDNREITNAASIYDIREALPNF